MLTRAERKRLTREFMGGCYDRPPVFDRFFKHVNGFEDPTALILREGADLEGQERLRLDDEFVELSKAFLRNEIDMLLHGQRQESRPLHWDGMIFCPEHVKENYACLLWLNEKNGVNKVLEGHADSVSASTLSVLDFGAGTGRAFVDLLQEDVVSSEDSSAVTLASSNSWVCDSGNMVFANAVYTAPQDSVSFDAVFSIYGVLSYHPFSFNDFARYANFGLLHLLNFTKVGGLLFLAGRECEKGAIQFLEKCGVLERIDPREFGAEKEWTQLGYSHIEISSGVYRVLRKMNYWEVLHFLSGGEKFSHVLSHLKGPRVLPQVCWGS